MQYKERISPLLLDSDSPSSGERLLFAGILTRACGSAILDVEFGVPFATDCFLLSVPLAEAPNSFLFSVKLICSFV